MVNRGLNTSKLASFARAICALCIVAFSSISFAQSGPTTFSLSGGLFTPAGNPVLNTSVSFKVEVRDATGACVLYSEEHTGQNLNITKGRFALDVGSGLNNVNNLENTNALSSSIFLNSGVGTAVQSGACGGTVDLNDGDNRVIRISYDLSGGTTWVAMSPDVPMGASAYTMVAESVQGKRAADLVQIRDDVAYVLNQSNVENIFSSANYARLIALLAGTSNLYLGSNPTSTVSFNGQRLADVGTPTAPTDAATKGYADTKIGGKDADPFANIGPAAGDGFVMTWDMGANKWVARANTIPNTTVVAGAYGSASVIPTFTVGADGRLTAAANVTISVKAAHMKAGAAINRIIATDPVTPNDLTYFECGTNGDSLMWTAGGWTCANAATLIGNTTVTPATYGSTTQIPQFAVNAQGRITNATNINIAYPVTSVASKTGNVTLTIADIYLAGPAAQKDYGTDPGDLVELDGTGRIPAGVLPVGTGDITEVGAGSGLLGGGTSGAVTLSVNVGTGNNQIVQLNGSAQLPAVDGSLLTGVNATKLQTRDVLNVAPNNNDVLSWNNVGSRWEPVAIPSAPVQTVAGRVGNVTLTWNDIGNATGAFVKYHPNGVACNSGEVLSFDGTNWVCAVDGGGDITAVNTGNGLLGGAASGAANISVNAGTGANQIVQLDASSRIPAVNGSLLTNVDAISIRTQPVSSLGPTTGHVLKWNGSAWESAPDQNGGGDITDVVAGIGMLGGGTSGAVTVSVNVGTGANQIVQLDGSSRIPAVNGSLLTNVNAVALQGFNVAATAPAAGKFLGWNSTTSVWEPRDVAGTAAALSYTPTGSVAATNVQDAITEVDAEKVAKAGDTMTGALRMNNQAVEYGDGDNSNYVAIRAPGTVGANITLTLPETAGTNGLILGTSGNGQLTWVPDSDAGGDITGVTAGSYLMGGGMSGTVALSVNVGTGANQVVALDGSSRLPAVNGSLLTNVDAISVKGQPVSSLGPTTGHVLKWNGSAWESAVDANAGGDITEVASGTGLLGGGTSGAISLSVNVGTGANQIVQLNGSSQLPAVDGTLLTGVVKTAGSTMTGALRMNNQTVEYGDGDNSNYVAIRAPGTVGANITLTLPETAGTNGLILGTSGNGQLTWVPDSDAGGDITGVTAGSYMLGGGMAGTVALSVNVGTGANQVVALDGSSRIPAVNGSLLTNVDAISVKGQPVSSLGPTTGHVLKWNGSAWESAVDANAGGDITEVASGTGLLGGGTSGAISLSVNVGTGANQIVQLDGSSRLPAVDGTQLTGVVKTAGSTMTGALRMNNQTTEYGDGDNSNYVAIRAPGTVGANITLTLPETAGTNGLILGTSGNGQLTWVPDSDAGGDITGVTAGSYLMGGGMSGTVALSVNVGTGANQVVALDGSSRLPAVNGSLLTNVDAISVKGQPVSSLGPTTGHVLKWNGSAWESALDANAGGDITDVVAGNGLLGGGTSGAATLSVNAGTGANQIVQLNGSSQLPAVDGSLLTGLVRKAGDSVGSSRVDLQACKLEYSIVSPK